MANPVVGLGVTKMLVPFSGIVYDAGAVSRILGLPCRKRSGPVPGAADGEIVVYYGGWDLKTLRTSTAGKKRMWQDQDWYEKEGWKAESGYYRLNLRVPSSNQKNWDEQIAHLRTIDEAAEAAPIAVAATALLVHLTETGNDLFDNDWCRCAEPLPDGRHAGLTVSGGRVHVDFWDGFRGDAFWLASSRLVVPRKS